MLPDGDITQSTDLSSFDSQPIIEQAKGLMTYQKMENSAQLYQATNDHKQGLSVG